MSTTLDPSLFTAQHGEDRLLLELFEHRTEGFFVEIGAYDGIGLSNTYLLERLGWTGVLVEPIPELAEAAREARPRSHVVQAACSGPGYGSTGTFTKVLGAGGRIGGLGYLETNELHAERCRTTAEAITEIQVPVTTVDAILESCRTRDWPGRAPWTKADGWRIDLVSIDTEGHELEVLTGFDLARFRPTVLLVENDRPLLPSAKAVEAHLQDQGYVRFHRQDINDFYARPESIG